MTLRHGLILVAALSAALPAAADDINDQILSTLTPSSASPSAALSIEENTYSDINDLLEGDLWKRVRKGFAIQDLDSDLVRRHETWYSRNPEQLRRLLERSGKYLYFVVEEVEKRGLPTELALLPIIESAYNPKAYSRAHAAGIWQFIPSTGKRYGLEQTWWYDGRRDIFAATQAALDYLSMLYGMFGDWQLALAAYNWGEGSVSRAIARNQAKGLPTDYASLRMPNETRNYVPKLLAVRNLLNAPEQYGLSLPPLENKPYFTVVSTTRHMDLTVAARLADMSVEEFLSLNPAYNQPVIAYKSTRKLLVPVDKAAVFADRVANATEALLTWDAYQVRRGETLSDLARQFTTDEDALQSINRLSGQRLKPGQLVLVPRRVANTRIAAVEAPAPSEAAPASETRIVLASSAPTGSAPTVEAVAQTVELESAAGAPASPSVTLAGNAQPAPEAAPTLLVARADAAPAELELGAQAAARIQSERPAPAGTVAPDATGSDAAPADAGPTAAVAAEPIAVENTAGETTVTAKAADALAAGGVAAVSEPAQAGRGAADTPEPALEIVKLAQSEPPSVAPDVAAEDASVDTAQPQATRHTVVAGDTLFALARRYGRDMDELERLNGLKGKSLRVGMIVALDASDDAAVRQRGTGAKGRPAQSTQRYRVKAGDTAYGIARRFSVSMDELLRWNGLTSDSILRPGDDVIIRIARS